jgi:hypothetical protein
MNRQSRLMEISIKMGQLNGYVIDTFHIRNSSNFLLSKWMTLLGYNDKKAPR